MGLAYAILYNGCLLTLRAGGGECAGLESGILCGRDAFADWPGFGGSIGLSPVEADGCCCDVLGWLVDAT